MAGESFEPSELGTPQGGPLSPLLANILLDDLDRELERRGHRFARYADDLLILVRSQRAGERVKTEHHRVSCPAAPIAGQRAKEPCCADRRLRVPRVYFPQGQASLVGCGLRGLQTPGAATHRAQLGRFDGLPARQARAVPARLDGLLRHLAVLPPDPRTGRVAAPARAHVLLETVALGAHQGAPPSGAGHEQADAILTAISSKSYWHLSRSLATQTGMTNEWLEDRGLVSIRALWMRAQGYA